MRKIVVTFLIVILLASAVYAQSTGKMTVSLLSEALSYLTADVAVGNPITVGDKTLIPLFKATTGFGGGGGGPDGVVYGSGVGGSLEFLPFAIVVISGEHVNIIPVLNEKPFFEQLVDALPQIMPIVMQFMSMFGSVTGAN